MEDSDSAGGNSQLTDWVIENLESANSSITSFERTIRFQDRACVLEKSESCPPVRSTLVASNQDDNNDDDLQTIRLLVGQNGWGTGDHPTTSGAQWWRLLCLIWCLVPGAWCCCVSLESDLMK
jgi:hypothetical protein